MYINDETRSFNSRRPGFWRKYLAAQERCDLMTAYKNLSSGQKLSEYNKLKKQFEAYAVENLALDMSRGKPGPEQLDLAAGMHTCLSESDYYSSDGID